MSFLPPSSSIQPNPSCAPSATLSMVGTGSIFSLTQAQQREIVRNCELEQLLQIIIQTRKEVYVTRNYEVVLVLGLTGSGKSTLIDYLAGGRMCLHSDPEALVDTIKCDNPVAAIGDTIMSCTDKPYIYQVPSTLLAFCDCPGHDDNRGAIREVANAIGIQGVAKQSRTVKGIVLVIEYASLTSIKGQGVDFALRTMLGFLGQNLQNAAGSMLILLSKVPNGKAQAAINQFKVLAARNTFCMNTLKDCKIGVYSPLDDLTVGPNIYTRQTFLAEIGSFPGIQDSQNTFNIVLSDEANLKVLGMVNLVSNKAQIHMEQNEFVQVPELLHLMNELHSLNIPEVVQEIIKLETIVMDRIKLLQIGDEKAKGILMQLVQIMPQNFQPAVRDTLQRLESKLAQEKKDQQQKQEIERQLKTTEEQLQKLQRSQATLEDSLKLKTTNVFDYQYQNAQLQLQIADISKASNGYSTQIADMNSRFIREKSEAESRRNELVRQHQTTTSQLEGRISGLEEQIRQRQVGGGMVMGIDPFGRPVIMQQGGMMMGGYPMFMGGFR